MCSSSEQPALSTGYPAWTRTGPKVPSGLAAFLQRFGKSDKASFAEPDYAGPGMRGVTRHAIQMIATLSLPAILVAINKQAKRITDM